MSISKSRQLVSYMEAYRSLVRATYDSLLKTRKRGNQSEEGGGVDESLREFQDTKGESERAARISNRNHVADGSRNSQDHGLTPSHLIKRQVDDWRQQSGI